MLAGLKDKETEILAYLRALAARRKGFTLAEVLVTAFILSVVAGALFLSLTTGEFSNAITSAKIDLQAHVRLVMDLIVKDVRQANILGINNNSPSVNHIRFKKVTGIDNTTGSYSLSANYTDYTYDPVSLTLTRSEIDAGGNVIKSIVFSDITQAPFYTALGVPLVFNGLIASKKLIIVISGRRQARQILNFSLSEEVKIRNP